MTLEEIARQANVSVATVSRTINRVPTVDPALAKRVRRVIEREDYCPNTLARALVSGRSRIFGLVADITNPFFSEVVQTFANLGVRHNYDILLISIDEDRSLLDTAARQMIARRIDGIAILAFGGEEDLIDVFRSRNVPVFAIDADSKGRSLSTVQIDYQHGVRQAVQHLAAMGHERIAFVSGPAHLKTAAMRKAAFQACMKEIELRTSPEMLVDGNHTMEGGAEAVSTLVSLPNRPTAVVCSNDLIAIGVMRKAFELSLNIPRDLSVVGFEDIGLAQYTLPPLTTVQIPQSEMANAAFTALLDSAKPALSEDEPLVKAIATNLVLRASTTRAPGRIRNLG
jgi:LacI family transcriptional regulator